MRNRDGNGVRAQPLIAVTDVEASSRWYQRLLGCRSAHGGAEYERLVSKSTLILQLLPRSDRRSRCQALYCLAVQGERIEISHTWALSASTEVACD